MPNGRSHFFSSIFVPNFKRNSYCLYTLIVNKNLLTVTVTVGALKTCFRVAPRGVKTRFWTSQPPRISQKRFEMHQGCVFLDAESDDIIYFCLSAEMTKTPLRVVQDHRGRWKIASNFFIFADRPK